MTKMYAFGILLLLSLCCTVPATVVDPVADETTLLSVQYAFGSPALSTRTVGGRLFDSITVAEAPLGGNPGDPALPIRGAFILLPPAGTLDSVSVHGDARVIGTGYELAPMGRPIPITDRTAADDSLTFSTAYSTDTLFPAEPYSVEGVYTFRGFRILVLSLFPVQYNPVTGEAVFHDTLEVTVSLSADHPSPLYRGLPEDMSLARTKVDNPEVLSLYPSMPAPRESAALLILTTDALAAGFTPLAEAHNATGTPTVIRTLSDVGGSSPEAIRDYVRTMYSQLGISYLLLGGDDGTVPARLLWVEGMDENVTPYETFMPADHYFGCLDGTYNYDGDSQWGEPTDGEGGGDVDLLAEVYVGRACVDTAADVEGFVAKTVAYLSKGAAAGGKACFAGEYLGDYGIASYGSSYLEQLINGSSDDGYTTVGIPASEYEIDRLYDEDYTGGWSPQDIITRINAGLFLINHLGHAYYDYNLKLGSYDVRALTNTQTCFIYSQGCMSGGFDNPDGYDCIAEEFTSTSTHGAVAGVWNARYGFFWSFSTDGDSQRIHRQFWDAVYGEGKVHLGAANHDSKEDNLYMIHRSCIRWVYYETNLFGDPALTLAEPVPLPELHIVGVAGGFRKVAIQVQNTGGAAADAVHWSAVVTGGILHLVNISLEGDPFAVDVNATVTAQAPLPLFGLGAVTVQVRVDSAPTWTGTAMALGPFLTKVQAL